MATTRLFSTVRNVAKLTQQHSLRAPTTVASASTTTAPTANSLPQKLRPIHIPSDSQGNWPNSSWEQSRAAAAAAASRVHSHVHVPSASASNSVSVSSPDPDVSASTAITHHGIISSPPQHEEARTFGKIPTISLLRSIVTQELMARPYLMNVATKILRSNLKRLTGNALFRFVLDKMFYAQFCAGRSDTEIRQTVDHLKALGYRGVILNYAKEVDLSQSDNLGSGASEPESLHRFQVAQWLDGTIQTIKYAHRGDHVAVKYTGAGQGCVRSLEAESEPDVVMTEALDKVCQYAADRGVRLLFDAEHYVQKAGIDSWTMGLMEKYNRNGNMVVYNTYQMYLKESTATLAEHLRISKERSFGLGVKLVRGAYINSDPRHLIHDTIEDTHNAFDDAASMLATQHINDYSAPRVGVVLASHNRESMEKMRDLRRQQVQQGLPLGDVVYAQLMGMADELSLDLTQKSSLEEDTQVYKYVVWGSTEECMMYLLRRAEENRDAVERSSSSRQALWEEVRERITLS